MKNLADNINAALSEVEGFDSGEIRKAQRKYEVRMIWKELVEEDILQHTNAVYILTEKGRKQMHVYMDDSLYATELNNRRELISLKCRTDFGEQIDDFIIHISRGKRKMEHPFIKARETVDSKPPLALSVDEKRAVEEACSHIDDEQLRLKFKKAMISDLEWKKGNKR